MANSDGTGATRIRAREFRHAPSTAADPVQPEVVAKLRSGHVESYEELVRSLGPRVLATARRYLKSEADVADCFQETFLAVLQQIDGFRGESSLWHWVKGIATKQCLMKLRQYRRRGEESIENLLPTFDEHGLRVPSAPDAVVAPVEAQETSRLIRNAIARLPYDYRVIVLLRDIDGYSTEECSRMLGLSVNAVKTRLHRARAALRSLLLPLLRQNPGHP